MKRNLLTAIAYMIAGAACAAVTMFFTPSLNVLAGEKGSDMRLMMNDTPQKALYRAVLGGGFGALGGFGLAAYARRIRRKPSGP